MAHLKSIGGKIMLVTMSFVTSILIIGFILTGLYAYQNYKGSIQQRMDSINKTISPTLISYFRDQGIDEGAEIGRILKSFKDIDAFFIYNQDKDLILLDRQKVPDQPTPRELRSGIQLIDYKFHITGKIEYNFKTIGYVYYIINSKDLVSHIQSFLIFGLGSSVILFSFSFFLAFKAQQIISHRIKEVISTYKSGTNVQDEDELNVLIHAFDNLKKDITTRNLQMAQSGKLAAIGEVASSLAHEINNPLTIIQGKVSKITRIVKADNKSKCQDEVLEQVDVIKSTVERIAKVVGTLLKMTRKNDDKQQRHNFSFNDLLNDALTLNEAKFKYSGVSLNVFQPENDVMIAGDQIQLMQVVLNLLNNSLYYTKNLPTPWVELKYFEKDNYLYFEIKDCGTGIPKEIASQIMDPFFTTKPFGEGTGLGLSQSRKVILEHNGEFYLDESSPNTCFVFKIPILKMKAQFDNAS